MNGERYLHEFTYTVPHEFQELPGKPYYYGGQLASVTYPSGHQASFTYQLYSYTTYQAADCELPRESPSWGVHEKTTTADLRTRKWTFSQGVEPFDKQPYGKCEDETDRYEESYWQLNRMVDPAGNTTEMLFETPYMPGTPQTDDDKAYGNLRALRNYEGDVDPDNLVKEETYDWKLLDEHWRDYDWVKERIDTYYHDDVPASSGVVTQLTEERSEFDSFGHHQKTVYSGNAIGERQKIVVSDYLSDNESGPGTLCPDAQTAMNEWLGNLLVREEILYSDSPPTEVLESQTRHGYNLTKGLRTKSVAKLIPDTNPDVCESVPTPAGGDIVTTMTHTDDGDLWTKQIEQFGSGGTVFGWSYTYADGALESQKNDGLDFFDFVRTIDPDTGLVLEEKTAPGDFTDPDAVVTSYEYDILGRTTQIAVGDNLEPLTIAYENDLLDAGVGSYRLARIRSSRGTGDQEIETVEHYDELGRVAKTASLRLDDSWVYQHTEYNDAGRVSFVSEWASTEVCDPSCAETLTGTHTYYTTDDDDCDPETGASVQDALGRPRCVKGPLGEITKYEYWGTNKTVTVENVAIAGKDAFFDSDTADSETTYYTDGLGRLRAVDSPNLTGGNTAASLVADAIYDYDPADRLVKVNLVTDLSPDPTAADRYAFDNNVGQVRTFTFDKLGRQTTSTHPESGLVKTFEWNALGSPTKVQDALGLARGHHHETSYDTAGRPEAVHRVLDSTETPLDDTLAASAYWSATGWDLTTSTDCVGEANVWYVGSPPEPPWACSYGYYYGMDNPATLMTPRLPLVGTLPEGATLSFRYFREVRDQVNSGGTDDRLRVLVREKAGPIWTEVFKTDASQHSWSKWRRSPAIPLDNEDWYGKAIEVQFEFTTGTENSSAARGIAISDVKIQKPQSVQLSSTEYDTDLANCDDDGGVPNLSNGKVVRTVTYDESTGAPSFTKELCYEQAEGQLSKETTILDWDRDGQTRSFESTYSYNDMAQLSSQVLPHLSSEPEEDYRQIDFVYRHGNVDNVKSSIDGMTQQIVDPFGFVYNDAGGVQSIRYPNLTTTTISPNQAYLPHQISTTRDGVGTPLFDTGLYEYDGSRNISKIGNDVYRYDLVGRLRRAKVYSEDFGSGLYLDYRYDVYGNMSDRLTSLDPLEINYSPTGPDGLDFGNRSYDDAGECDNRIHDAGFEYDDNGNLIEEPIYGYQSSMGNHRFSFTPENRMTLVRPLIGGEIYQESQYDAGGDRWARVISSDGGIVLITLRDASGQVVAEYIEDPSMATEPVAHKHYVYGNGKLLATHSLCGPSPHLTLPDENDTPGEITLDVGFGLPGVTAQEFVVYIEDSASGQYTTKTLPGTTTQFTLEEPDLFTGENLIRIRAELECGGTGYSNGISYQNDPDFVPGGPDCIAGVAIAHRDWTSGPGESGVRSTLRVQVIDKFCHPSATRNVYYRDPQGQEQVLAYNITEDDYYLPDTPPGAGHGEYWFATNMSPDPDVPGPEASNDEDNAGGGSAGIPGSGMWKTEYVHSDHLGSTRLVTDEVGIEVASYKYYPFGLEAETSSGSDLRMKFTGHERDAELALDYMKARYCGAALGRFITVDPIKVNYDRLVTPGAMNLYTYVLDNPLRLTDPSGMCGTVDPSDPSRCKINADPDGDGTDEITFVNNTPGAPSPDDYVTTDTAEMVEGAVAASGVTVNINSTTGRVGATANPNSRHPRGMAVDINKINGQPVDQSQPSPAPMSDVANLQAAFAAQPNVRENYGPARQEKTRTPGGAAAPMDPAKPKEKKVIDDHKNHIHIAGQK